MPTPRRRPAGLTLLELLLVLSVMVAIAGLVLPRSMSGAHDQLDGAAQIVAGDLAYGRGLALMNTSSYRFTFDLTANSVRLEHSGASAALNTLPRFPFPGRQDTATRHVVSLDELPRLGPAVRLEAVVGSRSLASTTEVQFGPLGETSRAEDTTIWLSAGQGDAKRYLSIAVNHMTGLATVGTFTGELPAGVRQ